MLMAVLLYGHNKGKTVYLTFQMLPCLYASGRDILLQIFGNFVVIVAGYVANTCTVSLTKEIVGIAVFANFVLKKRKYYINLVRFYHSHIISCTVSNNFHPLG